MNIEDKVVNASTNPCPNGRNGLVTTKTYQSGKVEYECTQEDHGPKKREGCTVGIFNNCRIYLI